MKKFNKLKEQLKILESQKKTLSSIEDLSLFQFIKYKNLPSKEKKLISQMQEISNLGKEINFWYDTSTQSWIQNPKINCRKYCKLEKKANYRKEKKLYNLGLINKKPVTRLSKKFNKISNKFNYFKSYVIPKAFNKLVIYSAKKCISGYRTIEQDMMYFRNCISNTNSVKYLKSVKNEAIRQLSTNNSISFRDSIKVNNITPIPTNRSFQHIKNKNYDIDYYL